MAGGAATIARIVGSRATSGQARWLAPLAVSALAIAILVVAAGSGVDENGGGDGNGSGAPTEVRELTTAEEDGESSGERQYVVQPGDTLSSIAIETGVPVEELQALNPDVDPQALASGERLKLR